MSTDPVAVPAPRPAAAPTRAGRLGALLRSPVLRRRLALASIVVNVGIVVTGGAVRLTNSGLGCPTWPHCSGAQLVPTRQLGVNGIIEFTNRTLTFVVGVVLLATLLVAWRQHRQTRLALVAFLGVPAQAVLGGIVVLTHLNPWLVASHFLLSSAIIAATVLLWWRVSGREPVAAAPPTRALAAGLVVLTAAVLAIGTVVTGTGPHAGDASSRRYGFNIEDVARIHGELAWVTIAFTIAVTIALYRTGGPAAAKRRAWELIALIVAQGAVGYTQYFLGVPAGLVLLHMLGAVLMWIAAFRLFFALRDRGPMPEARPRAVPARPAEAPQPA